MNFSSFNHSVTEWFHTPDSDDITPAVTAGQIIDLFLNKLDKFRLDLVVPQSKFRNIICEFFCEHYAAFHLNQNVRGPRTFAKKPNDWSYEIYERWFDYLDHYYFNYEFWDSFWYSIEDSEELNVITNWQNMLTALLPYFIKCDSDILVEAGIIVMKEGIAIAKEDDYTDEYEQMRKDHWDY